MAALIRNARVQLIKGLRMTTHKSCIQNVHKEISRCSTTNSENTANIASVNETEKPFVDGNISTISDTHCETLSDERLTNSSLGDVCSEEEDGEGNLSGKFNKHNKELTPYAAGQLLPLDTPISRSVLKAMESVDQKFSPKRHPGHMLAEHVSVPIDIQRSIRIIMEGKSSYLDGVPELSSFLYRRQVPFTSLELNKRMKKIEKMILDKKPKQAQRLQELTDLTDKTVEEEKELESRLGRLNEKVMKMLRNETYFSKSIVYDKKTCYQYLAARGAQNFAIMYRILYEIKKRDPEFHPHSVFDMGSGVGSTAWAVNALWPDGLVQQYCVDASEEMLKLSSLILRGGNPQGNSMIRHVTLKANMPSTKNQFSMVVCAHTLMDVKEGFRETVLNLWKMSTNYLVFVDNGTYHGFKTIMTARKHVLQYAKKQNVETHVFSPCPHDKTCHKVTLKQYRVTCTSNVFYKQLKLDKNAMMDKDRGQSETYSYVVLKKGPIHDELSNWPRLISPTKHKVKHLHCYMCTANGKTKHCVITKSKHQKLYRIAKETNWGDLLPIEWKDVGWRFKFDREEDGKQRDQLEQADSVEIDDNETEIKAEKEEISDYDDNFERDLQDSLESQVDEAFSESKEDK